MTVGIVEQRAAGGAGSRIEELEINAAGADVHYSVQQLRNYDRRVQKAHKRGAPLDSG